MSNAIRDNNRITVALGVSNADPTVTLPFKIDSVTGRLLVDASGGVPTFSDAEIPGGAINNSNVTFTLAHTPSPATSLQLTYQGQIQYAAGVDYTLVGSTITMNVVPQTGGNLQAWYRY